MFVLFLFIALTQSKYLSIHLYSSQFNLEEYQNQVKEKHTNFIPFNSTINQPTVVLYSTMFLDDAEEAIALKAAQILSKQPECEMKTKSFYSSSGNCYLNFQFNDCLNQLVQSLQTGLSFYRDPNHKNNYCKIADEDYCNEYGEPDVLDKWYAEMFLGYDQDYYNEKIEGKVIEGFNKVRIAYSNELRLVKEEDVITNIILRKKVSEHTVKEK